MVFSNDLNHNLGYEECNDMMGESSLTCIRYTDEQFGYKLMCENTRSRNSNLSLVVPTSRFLVRALAIKIEPILYFFFVLSISFHPITN